VVKTTSKERRKLNSTAYICHMRIFSFALLFIVTGTAFSQVPSQRRTTSVGNISLSVNNYGTFGKPDVRSTTQGPSSMAYPKGSGIEHLFEAGIWIGALVDGQVRVSTSSVDASSGYSPGGSGFEFNQLSTITERSKLSNSSNYSASAISHQDFLFSMTDSFVVVPGTSFPIGGHQNPLKAVCKVETYTWNFGYANYFVIANYEITNMSAQRWDSVYMGVFSDLVVRNVNVTRDAGTAFFNKGRNGVNKDFHSIYAYQSYGDDVDYTRSYGALQFLGMDWRGLFFNPNKPDTFLKAGLPTPKVNYNFWNFNSPIAPWNTPGNDQERYLKLAQGIDSTDLYSGSGPIVGIPANWLQLLSAGPLANINPGEKFTFTFAFVCAKMKEPISYLPSTGTSIFSTPEMEKELTEHLKRTRSTYVGEDKNENGVYSPELDLNQNGKLDRFVLPEPPLAPNVKVISEESKIEVYWDKRAESSVDPFTRQRDFEGYRIYRTNPGDDLKGQITQNLKLIGQWDSAGNDIGYNNGFSAIALKEPVKFDGDTTEYHYKYSFSNLSNGWQYLVGVTAFDKGDKNLGISSEESSISESENRVFTGTTANDFNGNEKKVGVYPNPYNTKAAWDGDNSRLRKLVFFNLPSEAEITIYASSGDVIASFKHNSETYNGEGIRWFQNYGDTSKTVMSGGEHAWDLLNESKTQISTGVYLFTVKDMKSGEIQSGTFAVIK